MTAVRLNKHLELNSKPPAHNNNPSLGPLRFDPSKVPVRKANAEINDEDVIDACIIDGDCEE